MDFRDAKLKELDLVWKVCVRHQQNRPNWLPLPALFPLGSSREHSERRAARPSMAQQEAFRPDHNYLEGEMGQVNAEIAPTGNCERPGSACLQMLQFRVLPEW